MSGLSRESPNSRINAIKKFIGAAPPQASRLRLLVSDQLPLPLGEWAPLKMGDQRDALAEEIEGLLIDHASENRRYRANYLLSWCSEEGTQVTVKQLSVYGHQLRADDTPEDSVRDLDGATMSQISQMQRHLEAMMRLHLQWQGNIVNTMATTIDRLGERLATVESSQGTKHDELLEAKETILGLIQESAAESLTPAQEKAFELVEKLAPGIVMWLQSQAARKPPSAPPNGASNPKTNGAAA